MKVADSMSLCCLGIPALTFMASLSRLTLLMAVVVLTACSKRGERATAEQVAVSSSSSKSIISDPSSSPVKEEAMPALPANRSCLDSAPSTAPQPPPMHTAQTPATRNQARLRALTEMYRARREHALRQNAQPSSSPASSTQPSERP